MTSLTLKDFPEDLLNRLRLVAHRERRSMAQQAYHLLERGLKSEEDRASLPSKEVTEQVARWRRLAGLWKSHLPFEEEVESLQAARTAGRPLDL